MIDDVSKLVPGMCLDLPDFGQIIILTNDVSPNTSTQLLDEFFIEYFSCEDHKILRTKASAFADSLGIT